MRKGERWIIIGIILVIVLFFWWGLPTFNKWRADKMVDDLCAKDGGGKVYETTSLSSAMFNEHGQPKIRFAGKAGTECDASTDEFCFTIDTKDIVGSHNASDVGRLAVWQSWIRLQRSSDGKVLGETILYSRRGGDAIGPWHPSSYSCPDNASEWDLARKVIVKKTNE